LPEREGPLRVRSGLRQRLLWPSLQDRKPWEEEREEKEGLKEEEKEDSRDGECDLELEEKEEGIGMMD